jgi:hypothetical protein
MFGQFGEFLVLTLSVIDFNMSMMLLLAPIWLSLTASVAKFRVLRPVKRPRFRIGLETTWGVAAKLSALGCFGPFHINNWPQRVFKVIPVNGPLSSRLLLWDAVSA